MMTYFLAAGVGIADALSDRWKESFLLLVACGSRLNPEPLGEAWQREVEKRLDPGAVEGCVGGPPRADICAKGILPNEGPQLGMTRGDELPDRASGEAFRP